MKYFYKFAAPEYNSEAYGAGLYGGEAASEVSTPPTTSTPVTPSNDSGPLAYTGYDVIIPAALGVAIVAASVIALTKKLRRKNT